MRFVLASLLLLAGLHPAQADSIKLLVQSSPLAGFQYHEGDLLWSELRTGDPLDLIREPDNSHDPFAVRIEWRGRKMGYLPRQENRPVAEEMDRGARVEARIARLTRHKNPWRRLQIEVFVVL